MTAIMNIRRKLLEDVEQNEGKNLFGGLYHQMSLYMSYLAYRPEESISKHCADLGATWAVTYDYGPSQFFIAKFNDKMVVSFRGTEIDKFEDIKTILKFWKKDIGEGLHGHAGFVTCAKKIEKNSRQFIEKIKHEPHILYTGHSMGGALACLMSYYHKPTDICTFGVPRLFLNKNFQTLFEGVEVTHIRNKYDIVTKLPFTIPYVLPYHDFKGEVEINTTVHPLKSHYLVEYAKGVIQ